MEYITLGTDKLLEEYFYQIVNSDRIVKPVGGVWCSNYYAPTFIEWLDFLTTKPRYYSRFFVPNNPFKMNGAVIKLYDDAKVFCVDSKEAVSELEQRYSLDFEKLSEEYDALYVDPFSSFDYGDRKGDEYRKIYIIKSLDVFNLSAVESYKRATVNIEPFDYTFPCQDFVSYNTTVDDEQLKVQKESIEYQRFLEELTNQLKDYIFRLRLEHPDFPPNKIVYLVKEEIDRVIGPDLAEYAKKNELNRERLAYSLSTKTYRRVK